MPGSPKKYVKNPYPGIRSFNINESELFYGREKQIIDLSNLLKKSHFTAISGASGSGKSSIVKAGIIPWFLNEFENSDYIVFRPGNNPIKNLSEALSLLFIKDGYDRKELKKILTNLNKDENALENIFKEIGKNKTILLYIDQFEEIFRYRSNEQLSKAEELSEIFIQNIINAVESNQVKIYVTFSLRSDFLSECSVFQGLPELINRGHYLLPKMTDEQKEAAITMPAKKAGAKFSDNLLVELRKDIKNQKVSLPVIQHALMRTWENWLLNAPPETPIEIEHYKAIGTVNKALSFHAEDIYNSLNDEQKKLTEKIFRALTFFGDDERGIRSPQKLGDLCDITSAKEMEVIGVVEKFRSEGNSFLMPADNVQLDRNTVIDIAHESIMRVWERLIEWVEKETKSAHLYIRLSKSAELFQSGKTGILVNPDLQISINWLENDRPNAAWAIRYDPSFDRVVNYIFYSKKEHQKSVAAQQAKKERSFKRTRIIAFILGTASLISILLMIVSLNLRFKAVQSEKDALEKKRYAEKQTIIAEERRKNAVALGLVANQQQEIAEQNRLIAEQQKRYAVLQQREALYQQQQAIIARNDAIQARDFARQLQLEAEILRDSAISQKFAIQQQKVIVEHSKAQIDTLRRLAVSKTMAIKAYQLYFDNQKADNLTDEDKKLPAILALQAYYFNKQNNGNPLDPDVFSALLFVSEQTFEIQNVHTDAVRDIAVSNNDNFISAGADGKIFLLNYFNNSIEKQVDVGFNNNNEFRTIQTSDNGNYTIAGLVDGQIFMWKGEEFDSKPISKKQGNDIISDVKFLSNEAFVASDNSGKIVFYNINDITFVKGNEIQLQGKINALEVVGSKIIAATNQGRIYILRADLVIEKSFDLPNGSIQTIAKAQNDLLLVGFTNGLIEVVDFNGNEIDKWFAHNSAVTKIVVNNLTGSIITAGYDKVIKIWNYFDTKSQPIKLNIHNSWIYSLALSKDNKYIISADASGVVKITLIDIDYLMKLVKSTVTENMSEQNWDIYVGQDIDYSPDLPADL
ncbi:MAG: hypothetical protein JXR68_05180 [Bacteroidales bacterium]|nr:hypothetical protein [Bacteroidales bacterium]